MNAGAWALSRRCCCSFQILPLCPLLIFWNELETQPVTWKNHAPLMPAHSGGKTSLLGQTQGHTGPVGDPQGDRKKDVAGARVPANACCRQLQSEEAEDGERQMGSAEKQRDTRTGSWLHVHRPRTNPALRHPTTLAALCVRQHGQYWQFHAVPWQNSKKEIATGNAG